MTLLMLTKLYPFGTGEAFIENEIPILARYYEKIVIVACEVPREEERIRELPECAAAYRIDSVGKSADIAAGLIKYFFSGSPDMKSGRKECRSLAQRVFLSYFEAKSRRIFREILQKNILDQLNGSPYILYSYWLFVTARTGTLISARQKPVYSFTRAHRYDLYADKNRLNYLPFRALLLSGYDRILPCSDNGTEYLKKLYPQYADKIRTSFLGTGDHGVGCASTDGVFRIFSCSRVVPVKRVDRIVSALKILDDKRLKIKWTHIGGGEGLDALKAMTADKLKYIRYEFTGDVPNRMVLDMYRSAPADLFVNVSSSEGLPVSVMEAMSFGIPTVATDVGGTSEIVSDLTGKLIPDDFDDSELAAIIEELYLSHDTKSYRKLRKDCRRFWEEHFQASVNYDRLCRDIVPLYNKKLVMK